MVASPTPTVPISSDSTRVMVARLPRKRANVAAATQPAVPPPAMTISRGEDRVIAPTGGAPAALTRRRQPLQIRIRVPVPPPEEVAAAEADAAEPDRSPSPGSMSRPGRSALPAGAAEEAAAVEAGGPPAGRTCTSLQRGTGVHRSGT